MESQFPYLLLIALVFLFFIIIPSIRRNSKEKKFLNNLKRGDRIITKSGVHARITEFDAKSNTCIIETMAGKLKIEGALCTFLFNKDDPQILEDFNKSFYDMYLNDHLTQYCKNNFTTSDDKCII